MNQETLSDQQASDHIEMKVYQDYNEVAGGRIISSRDFNGDFKRELESNLYQFDFDKDQLKYCQVLYSLLKQGLDKHMQICKKPKPCPCEEGFKHAIFIVDRKLASYIEDMRHSVNYVPLDPYTTAEVIEIFKKLQEISDRLKRVELGQQITYDDLAKEISDLKKLTPILGKRKFTELFIGSLVGWATNYGLKSDTINSIYQFFTSSEKRLIE